jgi:hypothetical protein
MQKSDQRKLYLWGIKTDFPRGLGTNSPVVRPRKEFAIYWNGVCNFGILKNNYD